MGSLVLRGTIASTVARSLLHSRAVLLTQIADEGADLQLGLVESLDDVLLQDWEVIIQEAVLLCVSIPGRLIIPIVCVVVVVAPSANTDRTVCC